MMNEYFLQYIWQYALYHPSGMKDLEGKEVVVIQPGIWNKHAGPDFTEAKIRIGDVEWIGNVEIHIRASDWYKHKHQEDKNYQNIILHVVYDNEDMESVGAFPTLELKHYIKKEILDKYLQWNQTPQTILCRDSIAEVPEIIRKDWLQHLLVERWMEKTKDWKDLFLQLNNDWRSLLYVKLAENLGMKVNAFPMRHLALSVPLTLIEKVADQPQALDALFFGQSGLLPDYTEDQYVRQLKMEYRYLQQKFQLEPPALVWKFFRLHPPNFPTIRIAQLAALMRNSFTVLNSFLEVNSLKELQSVFEVKLHTFWDTHFQFQKESSRKTKKTIGTETLHNLIINTIAPFRLFYGKTMEDENRVEASLDLIAAIPPENNRIIKEWATCNIKAENAFESQALIQVYNRYCTEKRCLECRIGSYLLTV